MNLFEQLLGGGHDVILLLIVQVALILGLSRGIGMLFQRLNQPQVVGEMLAGHHARAQPVWMAGAARISCHFSGNGVDRLPECSQPGRRHLSSCSWSGWNWIPELIRNRGHAAVVISHVSIVAPFLLGTMLTLLLYSRLFNHSPHMQFHIRCAVYGRGDEHHRFSGAGAHSH